MGELQGRETCSDSRESKSTDDTARECKAIDFNDPDVKVLMEFADAMGIEGEQRIRYIRNGLRYLKTVL